MTVSIFRDVLGNRTKDLLIHIEYNAFACKTDSNQALCQNWQRNRELLPVLSRHLDDLMLFIEGLATSTSLKKLLVVCMGNICRSPMAQVVLQTQVAQEGLASKISIDSAGTHASSFGEKPDSRAEAALLRRGHEIGRMRSRKVSAHDFSKFDLILAMDANNLAAMQQICPPDQAHKLHLFLQFGAAQTSGNTGYEVPDPYYGNVAGFDRVLDLCEAGARQILAKINAMP
jgi:protein-tyrosine phosphatase